MRRRLRFLADRRGASTLEFALAGPILIALLMGIAQLGIGFYAAAGLKHAVAEGARLATIYPRPANSAIVDKINSEAFGLSRGTKSGPFLTTCSASGQQCIDITMKFSIRLDFGFLDLPPVTMTETRRVFVNPATS